MYVAKKPYRLGNIAMTYEYTIIYLRVLRNFPAVVANTLTFCST